MALSECLPIPYVPEKDSVQEMVSAYNDNHLKMLINKGKELRVPIWHSGTRKAFLINPSEGKTTAVVAVIRGNSKHGYHRHCSNKHYKNKIVRVLLDSGSDGDLVFVNKDKPMLLLYLKRLVPQAWNTSNGIFQTKRKARVELNFFDYSDSKWYYSEPNVVE